MKKFFNQIKLALLLISYLGFYQNANSQKRFAVSIGSIGSTVFTINSIINIDAINVTGYWGGSNYNYQLNITVNNSFTGTRPSTQTNFCNYNVHFYKNKSEVTSIQMNDKPVVIGDGTYQTSTYTTGHTGLFTGFNSVGFYTDPTQIISLVDSVSIDVCGEGVTFSSNQADIDAGVPSNQNSQSKPSQNITNSVLPITFSFVNASLVNSSTVNVYWATATEENASYYTVERSGNGSNWSAIGNVTSQALNGNSTSALKYNFTDENALAGTSYYRIQETDLDGNSYYSKIVQVKNSNSVNSSLVLYPNPAVNSLNLSGATASTANAIITVYNILGSKVLQKSITTDFNGSIDISTLPSGQYVLQFEGKGYKFVVNK